MARKTFYPSDSPYHKFLDFDFQFTLDDPDYHKGKLYYKWQGLDNNKLFLKNLKIPLFKEQLSYYIDNPIRYYVNDQNFRTSFDLKKKYKQEVDIVLGCSISFGVGMHEKYIWPTLLSEHTGVPIINLSIAGTGPDHAYVALSKVIDKFKIRNVYHYQNIFGRGLSLHRWKRDAKGNVSDDYYFGSILYNLGYDVTATQVYQAKYFYDTIMTEEYVLYEHKRAIDSIIGLCLSRDIPYFYFNVSNFKYYVDGTASEKELEYFNREAIDPKDQIARDILHPSRKQHKSIAERFIEVLNQDGYIEPFLDRVDHYESEGFKSKRDKIKKTLL